MTEALEVMMKNTECLVFPGTFTGKLAFGSISQNGKICYLSTVHIFGRFEPGLNGTAISETEKYIIYAFPDGYFRIQSQYRIPSEPDKRLWLALNDRGDFITYTSAWEQAGDFALFSQQQTFGASWKIKTADGDQQLYYQIIDSAGPNVLTVNHVDGDSAALVPTLCTPSIDAIRQQKQARKADFTNVILLGQDLQNIDFTSATFVNAQLAGVNFSGATLDGADLTSTDLRGLNWGSPKSAVGIKLTGSNLRGCTLGGLLLSRLNCRSAECSSADFTGAHLENLDLTGANLNGTILYGTHLEQTYLKNATLDGVVALGAHFDNADLSDASAQSANFTRAVFDNAILTRVKMGASSFLFMLDQKFAPELDHYDYPQSDLLDAFKMHGVTSLKQNALIEVREAGRKWFIGDPAGPYKLFLNDDGIKVYNVNHNLIPAILRDVSCQNVIASSAALSGANLRGGRWANAKLDHADLEDAVFTGAWLVETNFTQANVFGTDFSDTVLCLGNFTGCIEGPGASKRAVSFEGAHLEGVDFSKATFSGALLTDAIVALDWGVPLLCLPLVDEQFLTQNKIISGLKLSFQNAGFNLGTDPTVSGTPCWSIDNSQCNDQQAPRVYRVIHKKKELAVIPGDKKIFKLDLSNVSLMNNPTAAQELVSLFSTQYFTLELDAPITKETCWSITPSDDAMYIRPFRFMTMRVIKGTSGLSVFGTGPVSLQRFNDDESAFSATQNIDNTFSPNSVGPSGIPFSWIKRGLIEKINFWAITHLNMETRTEDNACHH